MAQTGSFSDFVPGQDSFVSGEYSIGGAFSLRQTRSASFGDLDRSEYVLETDFGSAQYSVLGGRDYFVNWGTYDLKGGLSYFAEIQQPFIELHFQLEGAVETVENDLLPGFTLRSGDANLVYIPPGRSEFAIDSSNAGSVFEVQLSPEYFQGLGRRYPALFGRFLEQMIKDRPFFLGREPVRITPEMWGVIDRVRRRDAGDGIGSLFLESYVLELLAHVFEQHQEPVRTNGMTAGEKDKMHAARELLIEHMTDPPSLEELARHVGTNEFALKQGFKTLFGTSPYAFALDHKLETVRSFVLDTDLTISEIAYRVGYSDPAHLTNAFRKKFGVPPSALRKPPSPVSCRA